MRQKQAEINSHVILYILLVVLAAGIVVFGLQAVLNIGQNMKSTELVKFKTSLSKDLEVMTYSVGSTSEFEYPLPAEYTEACFVDKKAAAGMIGSKEIYNYPYIENEVGSGTENNLFLVGKSSTEPLKVSDFKLSQNAYFSCYQIKNGRLPLVVEGTAKNALIKKEYSISKEVAANQATEVTSTDGKMTLKIPPGALGADTTVTVKIIPAGDNNFASEVYEFDKTPETQRLNQPAELVIQYNTNIVGPCPAPEQIPFEHHKNDGNVERITPKPVVCASHTATYKINSFSFGAIVYVPGANAPNNPGPGNIPVIPANGKIALSDFEDAIAKAGGNLIFGGTVITLNEMKDLLKARNVSNGGKVDLDMIGPNSNEKISVIYLKVTNAYNISGGAPNAPAAATPPIANVQPTDTGTKVPTADIEDAIFKAGANALFGGNLLTTNELKDLMKARNQSISGEVDLDIKGQLSNEKISVIYNKVKNAYK